MTQLWMKMKTYFFLKKASIMYKCEIPVIFINYIVVILKTHFEVIDLLTC